MASSKQQQTTKSIPLWEQYQNEISNLKKTVDNVIKHPTEQLPDNSKLSEHFFKLSNIRYSLIREIETTPQKERKTIRRKMNEGDKILREQMEEIERLTRLANWRNRPHTPMAAWSWFIDPLPPKWRYINAICSFLSILLLTVSLSFIVDISKRFIISDGIDKGGTFAIILQSLAALLVGSSILSKSVNEKLINIFNVLPCIKVLPARGGQVMVFLLSLFFCLFFIHFHTPALNYISNHYNEQGERNNDKYLSSAASDYKRAIKLNPDNAKAHYNLGRFYGEIQETKFAIDQYRLAVAAGNTEAYSKLAQLLANKNNYSEAASWLFKDLKLLLNDGKKAIKNLKEPELEKLSELEKLIYKLAIFYIKDQEYTQLYAWLQELQEASQLPEDNKENNKLFSIEKSWALAHMKSEDYDNAEQKLVDILASNPAQNEKKLIYCLLAITMNKLEKEEKTTDYGNKCVSYGSILELDEAHLVEEVKQVLNKKDQ